MCACQVCGRLLVGHTALPLHPSRNVKLSNVLSPGPVLGGMEDPVEASEEVGGGI